MGPITLATLLLYFPAAEVRCITSLFDPTIYRGIVSRGGVFVCVRKEAARARHCYANVTPVLMTVKNQFEIN